MDRGERSRTAKLAPQLPNPTVMAIAPAGPALPFENVPPAVTTEETPEAAASPAIETSPAGTLPYECPHCHRPVKIRDDLLGQTVNCPECDRPFRVPAPEARPIEPEDRDDAAAGKNSRHPNARDAAAAKTVNEPFDDEHVHRVIHPVVLRRHLFQAILCGILAIAGAIGLVMGAMGSAVLGLESVVLMSVSGFLILVGVFLSGQMDPRQQGTIADPDR